MECGLLQYGIMRITLFFYQEILLVKNPYITLLMVKIFFFDNKKNIYLVYQMQINI